MQPYILNCIIITILAAFSVFERAEKRLGLSRAGMVFVPLTLAALGSFEFRPCPELCINAGALLLPVFASMLPCKKRGEYGFWELAALVVMSGAGGALYEAGGKYAHIAVGMAAAVCVCVSGAQGAQALFTASALPVLAAVINSLYTVADGGYVTLDLCMKDILNAQSAALFFTLSAAEAGGLKQSVRRRA